MIIFSVDDSNLNTTRRSIYIYSLIALGCWLKPFGFDVEPFWVVDPTAADGKGEFQILSEQLGWICLVALLYLYVRLCFLLPLYDQMITEAKLEGLNTSLERASDVKQKMEKVRGSIAGLQQYLSTESFKEKQGSLLATHKKLEETVSEARELFQNLAQLARNIGDEQIRSVTNVASLSANTTPGDDLRECSRLAAQFANRLRALGKVPHGKTDDGLHAMNLKLFVVHEQDLKTATASIENDIDQLVDSLQQIRERADRFWRLEAFWFGRLVPSLSVAIGLSFAYGTIVSEQSLAVLLLGSIGLSTILTSILSKGHRPKTL